MRRSTQQSRPSLCRKGIARPSAPASRCVKALAKERKPDPITTTEAEDNKSSYFPELMSKLLWNASSMRERGKSSCNICKSEGNVVCPDCGGARVLSKASSRAQAHARARLASFMENTDKPLHRDQWLVTNRCPTCHGTGIMTCPACGGEGFRNQ